MLRQVKNKRIDPFTGATAYATISNEVHAIPSSGTYRVRLFEAPDETYTHPTSGTPVYIRTVSGTVFTEVSTSPGLNEFRVDYDYLTGLVEFNAGNADAVIKADYRGTGSTASAELINTLQRIPQIGKCFAGDGSDGDAVISADTTLTEYPAGAKSVFKQYANLTINAGKTLTIDANSRGLILLVSGHLKLAAGAKINLSGKGMPAGEDGGYGGGGGGANAGNGQDGGGNPALFSPGRGVGGHGGVAGEYTPGGGADGVAETVVARDLYWRSLPNLLVPGAGGGAGSVGMGGPVNGSPGGGYLIICCNVLEVASGALFDCSGVDVTGNQYGGAGAGGTLLIIAHQIVGASESTVESTMADVSGGLGGNPYGGDGAAGYKKVAELAEYNLY